MPKNSEPEPITQYRFGTGEPYVTKVEHAAALAAKDAELERAKDTLALVLGWKPGHWFDLTAKFRDEIRASEKGNRRLKKELAAKDAAITDLLAIIDDARSTLVLHFAPEYGKPFDATARLAEIRAGVSGVSAVVAAKDAAIRELLAEMRDAYACYTHDRCKDILEEAIEKHRPKEGADNA